jgi:hypothetical protein
MTQLLCDARREMARPLAPWRLDPSDWCALCQTALVRAINHGALDTLAQRVALSTEEPESTPQTNRHAAACRRVSAWLAASARIQRRLRTMRHLMETSFLTRRPDGMRAVFALLRALQPPVFRVLRNDTHATCVWSQAASPTVLSDVRVTVSSAGQTRTEAFVVSAALEPLAKALYLLGAWSDWVADEVQLWARSHPSSAWVDARVLDAVPTPALTELRNALEAACLYMRAVLRLSAFLL